MNTRLDLVIENFKEYLRNIRVSNIDGEIEIEYTPYLYDYIDDDLDFNEEYYQGLCDSFQRWLESVALDMLKESEAKRIKIIHNRMVFRNEDRHVQTLTLAVNEGEGFIATTKETRQTFIK